jgi:16S rRNA (guanine527-N7)-methyltransferase
MLTVPPRARSLVTEYLQNAGDRAMRLLRGPLLDRLEKLARVIVLWGSRTNLTAQPLDPSELAFHMIDSLAPLLLNDESLKGAFADESNVLDLGSGAGFPGLVLAAASRAKFTLIESRQKRASFLSVAAAEAGLKNVQVQRRQAKAADFSEGFDAVTARAFAAMPQFYSIAVSALKADGLGIFYANPSQEPAVAELIGPSRLRSLRYSIPRSSGAVERILLFWRN